MTTTSVWAPIFKSEEQDDGTIIVYGKATDDSLDRDRQRCDPNWLNHAMPEWFQTGANVREQHDSKRAVGVGVDHEIGPDGHYVKSHIVDPIAVKKVKAGVLKGYSIGIANPHISKTTDAPNGLIDGGDIIELSLCDRPSNPGCLIQLAKTATAGMEINAADFDEERGLVRCEELVEKTAVSEVDKTVEAGEGGDKAEKTDWAEAATAAALNGGHGCGCCDQCICSPDVSDAKAAEFDRDAALKLVESLTKADGDMPPQYGDEQSDAQNAMAAISIISRLIVSEAQEMCDNPAEDCDIQILLSAVSALRCFINREQQQSLGDNSDDDSMVSLAAEADVEKAKYNAEQLRQMLKEGKAFRNANGDPSYPIGDKEDLENAIHAVGRGSGDHDAIRAYIIRRAKALGASDMIPDNWTSNGNNKAVDVEVTEVEKTTEPETVKAAAVEPPATDPETLVKALTAALEKSDNPLRKTFEAIVEASTKTTAEALDDLGARLVKVEQMAVPGGPALRRTEIERKEARKNDLLEQAMRYKALAQGAEDLDLRRGYTMKAAQYEAQAKAL